MGKSAQDIVSRVKNFVSEKSKNEKSHSSSSIETNSGFFVQVKQSGIWCCFRPNEQSEISDEKDESENEDESGDEKTSVKTEKQEEKIGEQEEIEISNDLNGFSLCFDCSMRETKKLKEIYGKNYFHFSFQSGSLMKTEKNKLTETLPLVLKHSENVLNENNSNNNIDQKKILIFSSSTTDGMIMLTISILISFFDSKDLKYRSEETRKSLKNNGITKETIRDTFIGLESCISQFQRPPRFIIKELNRFFMKK